jgi:uncharacterized membrane protein YfcA
MRELLAVAAQAQASSAAGGIDWSLVIVFAVGVVVGRLWGRRAALRHLGEAEFRTRWANVRRIRRF